MSASAHPDRSPRAHLTLLPGLLAFLTMGVLQAVYGPAFPAFERKFGVNAEGVALVASFHFLGSAAAPLLTGVALAHFSTRRVANAGLVVLLIGVVLVALAPGWTLALAGALTGGLGLGIVSAALNTAYASLGTRPSNTVNAVFGLGSLLSPLLVVASAPQGLGVPFLVIAVLALFTLGAVSLWNVPEVPKHRTGQAESGRVPLRIPLMFSLLLGTYVSLEVGFGAWIATHLTGLNWTNPALIVSGYWAGLMIGRLLTGAFGARFQPQHLVLGAVITATLATLVTTLVPTLAAPLYLLAGLAVGPVFPTTLVWLSRAIPVRTVPFLLISGSLGGAVSPSLIGWTNAQYGSGSIPVAFLALAALLLLLVLVTQWLTRPANAGQ
ncbi:MFS transporter [Deinococcus cavernae]|nr:MFS transporter [Deinococcus cavernae]